MKQAISFFARRQKQLTIAACLYVVFLLISHATLPTIHVWLIAAVFSIIMNLVYILEAYSLQNRFLTEASVALVLIALSIIGVIISPFFVVIAILGHGIWDIAKHFGAGVPFFSWYTLSCFAVDLIYSVVLMIYWLA